MNIKINNKKQKGRPEKNEKIKGIFLLLAIAGLLVYVFGSTAGNILAQNANQQEIQDKQEQIEDLQQKAENYRQMIQLKQDKAQTLENQINLMDAQIASLEKDVSQLQKQIDLTTFDIDQLAAMIADKEKDIGEKRKLLANVIQTYYENNQDSLIQLFLKDSNLSDFMSQADYSSQTGSKIEEVLASIVSDRDELESGRLELEKKNESQKQRRGTIVEKKYFLDNEQNSKAQLLKQTNGEEKQYQDLLARVEQQKQELLGDISEISEEKSSELRDIEASLKKPKSGLASTSWYFSQKDSRWGSQHIGFSSSTMKSYGCAVTSVSMVLKYHGVNINPGILAQQPIFYHDLIVWPQQWKGVRLESSTGHGNINWKTVDQELKNKNPVIVFVKAVKRGAGHYVVVHGKDKNGEYVVHDPIFGDNIFLSSTRAYVGALYNSGTAVDQMIIYH